MNSKTQTSYVDSDPDLITLNDTEFPDFEIIVPSSLNETFVVVQGCLDPTVPDQTNHTEEDEFADLPDLIPFDDLDDQLTNSTDDTPAQLPLDALSELIHTQNDMTLVCDALAQVVILITNKLDKIQYSNHTVKYLI